MASVGQRAANLLAVKVGGPQKNLLPWPLQPKCVQSHFGQMADSTLPGVESFSKFDGQ